MSRKKKQKKKSIYHKGNTLTHKDDHLIKIKVTKDADPDKDCFEGTIINNNPNKPDYRPVGEHSMFWLKSVFHKL